VYFRVKAAAGLSVFIALRFIDKPKGHMAGIQEKSSVEMIELNCNVGTNPCVALNLIKFKAARCGAYSAISAKYPKIFNAITLR
jgi:hypothetical protein